MYTEHSLGRELRNGRLTVEQIVTLFDGDEVWVYPAMELTAGEETWQEIEERGAGSTLFHDLTTAGATLEQMDAIGNNIDRLRAKGNTLDKKYGWAQDSG